MSTPFLAANGGQPVVQTVATGPEVAALRDSRSNPINSMSGSYLSARIAGYPTWLGSSTDWATMVLDLRTYLHPAKWWPGILALRSYDWLTVGRPPYMEPAGDRMGIARRSWDEAMGRGGSALGRSSCTEKARSGMPVTANGLIGVVFFFLNVSSFANPTNQQFQYTRSRVWCRSPTQVQQGDRPKRAVRLRLGKGRFPRPMAGTQRSVLTRC